MSSVGETLRRERQRKELSLEQISRETKISSRMLEAIERDQFDRLPGGVFAKNFVRQYARVLGLDEEELAVEVQKAVQAEPELPGLSSEASEPVFKVPKVRQWESSGSHSNSPLPALAMVVAVMLVCSGIYAWWQRSRRPAPAAARPLAAASVSKPTAPAPVTPAAANAPEAPPKVEISQAAAAKTDAEPKTEESQPANPAATLHVSLTADEDTWVRAWADGKTVVLTTLQPNTTRTVDAVDQIRIRTGNAGALQVTCNGKAVGPLGPKGQIRIVEVTPAGVQILSPPKPAPEPEL